MTPGGRAPVVALLPAGELARELEPAVRSAGLETTADPAAADALVWCSWRPAGLAQVLERAPHATWVQLPYAGIENFLGLVDDSRTWTCAKDVYGLSVGELALGLLLAGVRRIDRYARASSWQPLEQGTLRDATVLVFGAGGIGRRLTEMLLPLGARVLVVSRSGTPVAGAEALTAAEGRTAVATADAVVLAVPLTDETKGLVDRDFLAEMKSTAWLVNVARGGVVVTDDLVQALEEHTIAGAGLDVTDPEPLPDGHRLWQLDNVIITPHVANTDGLGTADLAALVGENCRRFRAGEPLKGIVDPAAGY